MKCLNDGELKNMQKKYDWLLFDADETLFDYPSHIGLARLAARYGIAWTDADYVQFQAVNQPLWRAYQEGRIDIGQLEAQRFADLAARTGQPAPQLNRELQLEMAQLCNLLPGARELLAAAHGAGIRIGIITNGFAVQQEPRLRASDVSQYIDLLVVSELEGFPKPDKRLFEAALRKMKQPAPQRVLMIGDNPDTDIAGGARAGMDTAWYNPKGRACPAHVAPTYHIRHLQQLHAVVLPPR